MSTAADEVAVRPAISVTLSASRGAGGHGLGVRLARELGLRYLDRAIPASVAAALAVPLEEALEHDERDARGLAAVLARYAVPLFSASGFSVGPGAASAGAPDAEAYVRRTECVVRDEATRGALVMGRGGAYILAGTPGVLHVRLDGPVADRVAHLVATEGLPEAEARRQVQETDHSRALYVRHLYHRDWADPSAYHLVIRSPAVSEDACVDMVTRAVRELAAR